MGTPTIPYINFFLKSLGILVTEGTNDDDDNDDDDDDNNNNNNKSAQSNLGTGPRRGGL